MKKLRATTWRNLKTVCSVKEIETGGPGKRAQLVKAHALKAWCPECYAWSHSRRKKLTPKNCPLTSIHMPWCACTGKCVRTCTHAHTHKYLIKKKPTTDKQLSNSPFEEKAVTFWGHWQIEHEYLKPKIISKYLYNLVILFKYLNVFKYFVKTVTQALTYLERWQV